MKRIFLLLCLAASLACQAGNLTGVVTDATGGLLSFASITVKGTTKGAIANSQGKYSLNIPAGIYTLVCQHVGYKREEKIVHVSDGETVLNFQLFLQELKLEEVVIKNGEDPAIRIMREVIKKRDYYKKQVDSFSVEVYIKGLLRTRSVPEKVLGQKIDKREMQKEGFDSAGRGIVFLSESVTKVSYKEPEKYKYEVISSRQSGGGYGLSFPFFINFYTSNVSVFNNALNPRGFISPLADGAFHYYKFHYEGNFFEGDKMIDRIKVTPKRKFEPLFSGYLQIVDGEWRIHSLDMTVTKEAQLELLDTIKISQIHTPVTGNIWRTQNQVVYVAAKFFGFDFIGNFLNVYSNYNLDPAFNKKTFGRTFMVYDTAFNKRDSAYWNTLRPLALEPDEKKDFVFKDSLYKHSRDSMYTRRNIDTLRKTRKPVQLSNFFVGGVNRPFYSTSTFIDYHLDPFLTRLQYNTVEGLAILANQQLYIRPRKGSLNYLVQSRTRYGINNKHFNSYLSLTFSPKRDAFRNQYLQLSGGKRLFQINQDNPITAAVNTFYTLLEKRNYIKLYEAYFGRITYHNSFENGLRWKISANYEDRMPLENSTAYSFFKKGNTILPNHPYELAQVPFNQHQALTADLTLSFQPGQRYIQFPDNKVAVGSKYPTLEFKYAKGINGWAGSDVDFDRWRLSLYDDADLKMGGLLRYRLSVGGFFNSSKAGLPDYTHFNGNQTAFNSKYMNSFQLAPYYQYSNTEKLYLLAHAEHHFNGLLTNKIPLFNRLKWHLVGGSNAFYVNQNKYYVEAFAGIENILKIYRIDFVTAYQSQPGSVFGIRVGLGGIIGGALQRVILPDEF